MAQPGPPGPRNRPIEEDPIESPTIPNSVKARRHYYLSRHVMNVNLQDRNKFKKLLRPSTEDTHIVKEWIAQNKSANSTRGLDGTDLLSIFAKGRTQSTIHITDQQRLLKDLQKGGQRVIYVEPAVDDDGKRKEPYYIILSTDTHSTIRMEKDADEVEKNLDKNFIYKLDKNDQPVLDADGKKIVVDFFYTVPHLNYKEKTCRTFTREKNVAPENKNRFKAFVRVATQKHETDQWGPVYIPVHLVDSFEFYKEIPGEIWLRIRLGAAYENTINCNGGIGKIPIREGWYEDIIRANPFVEYQQIEMSVERKNSLQAKIDAWQAAQRTQATQSNRRGGGGGGPGGAGGTGGWSTSSDQDQPPKNPRTHKARPCKAAKKAAKKGQGQQRQAFIKSCKTIVSNRRCADFCIRVPKGTSQNYKPDLEILRSQPHYDPDHLPTDPETLAKFEFRKVTHQEYLDAHEWDPPMLKGYTKEELREMGAIFPSEIEVDTKIVWKGNVCTKTEYEYESSSEEVSDQDSTTEIVADVAYKSPPTGNNVFRVPVEPATTPNRFRIPAVPVTTPKAKPRSSAEPTTPLKNLNLPQSTTSTPRTPQLPTTPAKKTPSIKRKPSGSPTEQENSSSSSTPNSSSKKKSSSYKRPALEQLLTPQKGQNPVMMVRGLTGAFESPDSKGTGTTPRRIGFQ